MSNSEIITLKTERLSLLEIEMDDLISLHRLHSIPEVDEFNTLGIPESIKDTEKFVRQQLEAKSKIPRSSFMWKVLLKDSGAFIGVAGFSLSNNKFKLGEIYYKLDPAYWGKGYATELAKRLVLLGFDTFYLHKVEAGVATENIKSVKVLEKIGMTREGLRRKILPIRGEWKDNFHYAIVEDDPRDY
nr:GNAT family protein [uncultured Draconibacterium sp.]